LNATTHAIFGVGALAGTALLAGVDPPLWAYPVAAVAAWLPDVDNPRSTLGNGLSRSKNWVWNVITRPPSWALRTTSFFLVRTVGHRTLTHSLVGFALFLVPVWLLFGAFPELFFALVVGCASHILADALNTPGVPLLWPLDWRFRLLPGGIRSGGLAEAIVAVAATALTTAGILLLHPGIGGLI